MSVSALDGKAVVLPSEVKPGTPVLGHLTWFTVPGEAECGRPDLEASFNRHGLRLDLLPPAIEPVDAFRRATTAVQRSRLPGPGGRYVNLLVREVGSTAEECRRQMVREIVDSRNRRLEYTPAAHLVYTRQQANGEGRFATTLGLDDSDLGYESAVAACREAERLYERWREFYQAEALRSLLRRYVRQIHAVLARVAGGVYFVPSSYGDELERLGRFAVELQASWTAIPVIDTPNTRETVREAVAGDVARLLDALRAELAQEPGKRGLSSLLTEARGVLELITQYEEVLSQDLFDLTQGARLVRDAMVQALEAASR